MGRFAKTPMGCKLQAPRLGGYEPICLSRGSWKQPAHRLIPRSPFRCLESSLDVQVELSLAPDALQLRQHDMLSRRHCS